MHNSNEYFWSIVVEPGSATAAVWLRDRDETRVLSIGQSIPWNETDELVASVDAALSSAVEELPESSPEPTKTVFGVVPSWVEGGQIKKEYLSLIKEVSEKLSLSPVGFVIVPEAIAHEIKHSEGAPLTGVVIGVSKQTLDVSVYKLGNLLGTVQVGRSVTVFEDVIEGLSRFKLQGEAIPSRFILYGASSGELTEVKDTLTLADWKENAVGLTFLHTPQIVVSDGAKKAIALSFAGSSEMGEVKKLSIPEVEVAPDEMLEADDSVLQTPEELTDLGFVSEGDIANIRPIVHEDEHPLAPHSHKKNPLAQLSQVPAMIGAFFKKKNVAPKPQARTQELHVQGPKKKFFNPLAQGGSTKKFVGATAGGIIVLLVIAWWAFPKADITVYVAPQVISGRADLTLDSGQGELDVAGKIVPSHAVSGSVTGSKTKQATGSKTTGERAKGKITIRNGTSVPVKLAAGAFVAVRSDLRFSLDESASIAAAESPTTPGSAELSVTAEKIGPEFNIAQGESLTVSNYPKSEVDAVVSENAITGGTSRQVVAVSKADIDEVVAQLTEELKAQATSELSQKVPDTDAFIASTVTTSVSSRDVSAKAGDEASDVTATMTVDAQGVSITKHDLTTIATDVLSSDVPSGFTLRPEQIDAKFSVSGNTNPIPAQLTLSARLLPNTNPDEIIKKTLGTRPERISEVLRSIPGFVRAEVSITPRLPGPIRVIPFRRKSVTLSVVSAE